jgi:hypothetical protein
LAVPLRAQHFAHHVLNCKKTRVFLGLGHFAPDNTAARTVEVVPGDGRSGRLGTSFPRCLMPLHAHFSPYISVARHCSSRKTAIIVLFVIAL